MSVKASEIDTPHLRRLPYAEIHRILADYDVDTPIDLLDSSSVRVGDTAAGLLSGHEAAMRLIELIETSQLRTWKGRMRALYVLSGLGIDCPDALRAYRHCLHDKSEGVFGRALFGMVLMRDRASLPLIESLAARNQPGSYRHKKLLLAKKALETGNPYTFSPYYLGLWRQVENRPTAAPSLIVVPTQVGTHLASRVGHGPIACSVPKTPEYIAAPSFTLPWVPTFVGTTIGGDAQPAPTDVDSLA